MHDFPHDHGSKSHGHAHHHAHSHDHAHPHTHNQTSGEHLHSHFHADSRADELQVLSTQFVDGFRVAEDKTSYLRLAGIPFSKVGSDGLKMHLVDASIVSNWQIGTASPAFASKELSYMPYPGEMVSTRETMTFTYVSMTERNDVDLLDILAQKKAD